MNRVEYLQLLECAGQQQILLDEMVYCLHSNDSLYFRSNWFYRYADNTQLYIHTEPFGHSTTIQADSLLKLY